MSDSKRIEIKNIDHLGIVAGLIDEIGIVKIINEKLGIDEREKISSGKVVKAMIINGLGMVSKPLYLFSQFYEDRPVEKLLGKEIKGSMLNDDKIGRVMDEIYKKGLTNLFIEIVLEVIKKFKIKTEYAHLDSTSFHLHGEYKSEEKKEENEEIIKERPIIITRGYSRDHRPDLKQSVLDLIVSNDNSIPLLMRTGDGNETDKKVFGKLLLEFKKQINLESIMVGDSALYSEENIKIMKGIQWITRVPLTIKKARELIETIKKEEERTQKKLEELEQEEFEEIKIARYQLKMKNKRSKYYSISEEKIEEVINKEKKKVYKIKVKIEKNEEEIERNKSKVGRFILATNILKKKKLNEAEILLNYKNQQGCEQGFGFLKDPMFFADSFFVEKPSRVETILWIMSLCLLVYNLGQRELRNELKRSNNYVKNQVGKLINNPTLRWIFQCFQGIHELSMSEEKQIINLTEERGFILEFLPSSCQKYYL